MLTKTDCFAYTVKAGKPGCNALKIDAASCESCVFYKTAAEYNRQKATAQRRLVALGKAYLLLPRKRNGQYA